jgi:hypothetical protein
MITDSQEEAEVLEIPRLGMLKEETALGCPLM